VYGLAYWSDDPDGYPLYVLYSGNGQDRFIAKIDPESDEIMYLHELEHENGGRPGGAFISNQYDGYSWVFIGIANAGSDDRIDIWHLSTNLAWLDTNPMEGEIEPDGSISVSIFFNATNLQVDTLRCNLIFTHNASGGETIVPVTLIVPADRSLMPPPANTPAELSISNIYPNPFNSMTTVHYTLPSPAAVTIRLYDICGREVMSFLHGIRSGGSHQQIIDGSQIATGIYICRLETKNGSVAEKVVLVK
ncbi:MAG TPA: T9SS type A sorting domain-containing protein, partial [Bacteroidetes bacterium]|nr:T9SS type A sorting domain-containing protein [Bacteroidota bacterium]